MINKKILKEIIQDIAREKLLEVNEVEKILNKTLIDFIKEKYKLRNIECEILPSGEINIFVIKIVKENPDINNIYEISLKEAKKINFNIQYEEEIKEQIQLSFEQNDVKVILNNLQNELKLLQKNKEFEFFQSKHNKIITGLIKKVHFNEITISFPEGEGILKKNKILPNDIIKQNNFIKVYVEDVKSSNYNQVYFSRIHPNFIKEMLSNEISEINQGLITIKGIARDPGSKTKVAVHSEKEYLNAKKCCIGDKGAKIKNIIKEINGEKIEIILWDPNVSQFIINAFNQCEIKEVIEKNNNHFLVIIPQEEFKNAMGRNGQNVKLVKKLCKVKHIKLMTEEEKINEYKKHTENLTNNLINNLEIEEMMAYILINEGYETANIIANSEINKIAKINGFNEEIAEILINRAKEFIENEKNELKKYLKKNSLDFSLLEIKALSVNQMKFLLENNITSKNQLAFLDIEELENLFINFEETINEKIAELIIKQARNIN